MYLFEQLNINNTKSLVMVPLVFIFKAMGI